MQVPGRGGTVSLDDEIEAVQELDALYAPGWRRALGWAGIVALDLALAAAVRLLLY